MPDSVRTCGTTPAVARLAAASRQASVHRFCNWPSFYCLPPGELAVSNIAQVLGKSEVEPQARGQILCEPSPSGIWPARWIFPILTEGETVGGMGCAIGVSRS